MPRLFLSLALVGLALLAAGCSPAADVSETTPAPTASTASTRLPTSTTEPPSRPSRCDRQWEPTTVGVIESGDLTEISGAAVSLRHPGVIWLHNDSGSEPAVFAASLSGEDLGATLLPDLTARDWEDMALGPGPDSTVAYLYFGDIGDNAGSRESVLIHRIPEPEPGIQQARGGETLQITYPLEAVNAETLLVDPDTGDIVIAGQSLSGRTPLYLIPGDVDWSLPRLAEYIGEVRLGAFALATGGDVDRDRIVIRSYDEVFTWERSPGISLATTLLTPPCRLASVRERQGEAIALAAGGTGFFTASEGVNEPLLQFLP